MIFSFLTDFVREKSKTVLYLFITFSFKIVFHFIKAVEKLKQSNETANDFDLQESFFFGFIF